MSDHEPTDATGLPAASCEAVAPFRVGAGGWVYDANGDRVLVCDADPDQRCNRLYSERLVDGYQGHFICPDCGRIGLRMEEARPQRVGLGAPPSNPPTPP